MHPPPYIHPAPYTPLMKKFFMPVEHLRRIRSVNQQAKSSNLGSIKYLPYSLYTLISTIPMPWEENLRVEVLYHVNGSLCFINSKRKMSKEEFMQKWHKIENQKGGRCMKYPIFEDDEEIFEYKRFNSQKDNCCKESSDKEDDNLVPDVYSFYLNLSKKKMLNFTTFERRKNKKPRLYHEININRVKEQGNPNPNKIPNLSKHNHNLNIKHNLNTLFKNTRFFQITKMDWLEVSLIIIKQSHEMLGEILRKKKLSFLYLDFNFNLKNTRPLTTKERKKSRLGISFHLTREICKFFKMIVDSFVVYRKGLYDSKDLKESLKFIFSNVGILTGIYRYKYKTMKQIKKCKTQINNGIWVSNWRIYVFMMRGYNSLLQKYLKNLSDRLILGREYRTIPLKKQRLESNFDLELKREIIEELKEKFNKIQINLILRHMNEAWRCWKADIKYEIEVGKGGKEEGGSEGREEGGNVGDMVGREEVGEGVLNRLTPILNPPIPNLPNPITNTPSSLDYLNSLISTFVNRKAQWYISDLHKIPKNKKEINKKMGKLTRLYVKEEKERQREYLALGGITPDKAMDFYKSSFEYFKSLGNPKINFPDKNEIKHLKLAIEKNQNKQNDQKNNENQNDNDNILIFKIKKSLLTQRKFREINLTTREEINLSTREVYSIPYEENLIDTFLSSYLFYEADTLGIFPEYFKPGDEIDMKNIYKMCKKIIEKGMKEGGDEKWDNGNLNEIGLIKGSTKPNNNPFNNNPITSHNNNPPSTSLYEIIFKDVLKLIDINLLKKILLLFMDPILVDYLISRNNCTLVYKDMSFENHVGVIPGLAFSPFIFKIYLTLIDFYAFREFVCSGRIMRYMEKVYLIKNKGENNVLTSLLLKNINYFYNFEIIRISNFPNFKFEMAGVECSIEKKLGYNNNNPLPFNNNYNNLNNPLPFNHNSWNLQNGFYANLSLSSQTLSRFKSRVDQIVLTSQSSTFLKVITKWNSTVLGFINQFRELIPLNFFIPFEKKIQNVVKQGINSKMPIRFPSVIFYAPQEYGGLGMYKTECNGEDGGRVDDGRDDGRVDDRDGDASLSNPQSPNPHFNNT
ncbi:PRE-mRNA splicing factor PRP8, partial [Nosema bombycis CQ1]